MRYFYALMVWATELELDLARKYNNKQHVISLTQDLNRWRKAAQDYELNRRFA